LTLPYLNRQGLRTAPIARVGDVDLFIDAKHLFAAVKVLPTCAASAAIASISAGTFIFYMFLCGNDPTQHCKFMHDAYEHNYDRNRYVVHNDAPLSFARKWP